MNTIPLSSLHPILARPICRWKPVRCLISRLLSISLGNRLLHKLFTSVSPDDLRASFFVHAAREFGIRSTVEGVNNIPESGPLIVVANHPKGIPEGLALGAILQQVRPDAKLMVNSKLTQMPCIEDAVIPVDLTRPGGNAAAVRGMVRQLKDSGTIGIFPAGAISTFSARSLSVTDDPWSDSVAALARKTGASVVPVHFSGNNSWLFHTLTALGRRFRGLLYFHELGRDLRCATSIHARIGKPVSAEALGRFPDIQSVTQHLRKNTYSLGQKT